MLGMNQRRTMTRLNIASLKRYQITTYNYKQTRNAKQKHILINDFRNIANLGHNLAESYCL